MKLAEIKEEKYHLKLDLRYATKNNFTKKKIYQKPVAFLQKEAAIKLKKSVDLAKEMKLKIKIFDAYRPVEAQWKLWDHTPNPDFIADPKKGSPHSRGVAIDLTLIDDDEKELEMGTGFDNFTKLAFHGNMSIPKICQKNRLLLLGLMTAAGWDFYEKEWWHYQLFDTKKYPLIKANEAPINIM
ncbi:MAG: D-alanyl-D-alanine dipeptidase [Rickettsiales bacterium]|nr:D-alanyl-D-alanine dipeptidase [Rickettsiales bacterium]